MLLTPNLKVIFKNLLQNPLSVFSKSSHSSKSSNSRSSGALLAELEIIKQPAEILACQKKESYERKIKLLERPKELELEMEQEKRTQNQWKRRTTLSQLQSRKIKQQEVVVVVHHQIITATIGKTFQKMISHPRNIIQFKVLISQFVKTSYLRICINIISYQSIIKSQMRVLEMKPNQNIMKIKCQIAQQ